MRQIGLDFVVSNSKSRVAVPRAPEERRAYTLNILGKLLICIDCRTQILIKQRIALPFCVQ